MKLEFMNWKVKLWSWELKECSKLLKLHKKNKEGGELGPLVESVGGSWLAALGCLTHVTVVHSLKQNTGPINPLPDKLQLYKM